MSPILFRSLARTARTTTASRLLRRNLTASTVAREESPNEDGGNRKTGFDYHTVEDYHGMSAHEILSGPKEDPKFRHFTGEIVANLRRRIN
jgi:NADH dehydrogenase (ubiquinone) Fe-S protein 2